MWSLFHIEIYAIKQTSIHQLKLAYAYSDFKFITMDVFRFRPTFVIDLKPDIPENLQIVIDAPFA